MEKWLGFIDKFQTNPDTGERFLFVEGKKIVERRYPVELGWPNMRDSANTWQLVLQCPIKMEEVFYYDMMNLRRVEQEVPNLRSYVELSLHCLIGGYLESVLYDRKNRLRQDTFNSGVESVLVEEDQRNNFYDIENLPETIDVQATGERFVEQLANMNFSRPVLVLARRKPEALVWPVELDVVFDGQRLYVEAAKEGMREKNWESWVLEGLLVSLGVDLVWATEKVKAWLGRKVRAEVLPIENNACVSGVVRAENTKGWMLVDINGQVLTMEQSLRCLSSFFPKQGQY